MQSKRPIAPYAAFLSRSSSTRSRLQFHVRLEAGAIATDVLSVVAARYNDRYRLRFEGSLAVFLSDALAAGIEYRGKPDNLSVFREDSFKDVFIAWLRSKHVAITAAYARLGNIADKRDQDGVYLSLQGRF